jgi:hypothetical protein
MRTPRRPHCLPSLVVLGLLLGSAVLAAAPPRPLASAGVPLRASTAPLRAAPHPGFPVDTLRAAANGVWYTQEGATLNELNGSSSVTGLRSLSLQIPLVASPYPIGYELNGLSSTGDWYQILVGDNWPSCPGYETLWEVWSNAGVGSTPGCNSAVSMSTGDVIQLGVNFTSNHQVCLDLADVTTGGHQSICQAQPDSGATSFVTLSSTANANGYFTGPMTEIANQSATSCPDYLRMPAVSYDWPASTIVTGYTPWSDEWEYGGVGTYCYSGGGVGVTLAPADPATHYDDTASGTGYGPHIVAGQNLSRVDSAHGWRVQTDPVELTSVTVAANVSTIPLGGSVALSASVVGGRSPYTALWYLNGSLLSAGGVSKTWSGSAAGAYTFSAYGVDKSLDVIGPSNTATVRVNPALTVAPVAVDTISGNADVGQTVTLTVTASGGIPPYTYAWLGLPNECPGADAGQITCTPITTGSYSILVNVQDSARTSAGSSIRPFLVDPAFFVTVTADRTQLDLNQSVSLQVDTVGGAGPDTVAWRGLPPPCAGGGLLSLVCFPRTAGTFPILTEVTDANGFVPSVPPLTITVSASPSVALSASRTNLDAGTSVMFTASVDGGTGPFVFLWSGLPSECFAADAPTVTCAPIAGGTLGVSVAVSDATGTVATAPIVILFVAAPLVVNLSGPTSVQVGDPLQLNASIRGGTPGATYAWSGLPDGCATPTGSVLSCQPTTPGTYVVAVTVTDSGGGASHATFTVHVGAAASGNGAWLVVGLVALIAAVGITVAVLVVRSRGSR